MSANYLESDHRPMDRTVPAPLQTGASLSNRAIEQVEPILGVLLDELDYGMVMLREGGRVIYVNQAARIQLREGHCMAVENGTLRSRHQSDWRKLAEALAGAQHGRRCLITLGADGARAAIALIPLAVTASGVAERVAAVFGRRRLCEQMSVHWFARAHGLTPAETRVLELLCEGLDPRDIASLSERGIATVRTQVNKIRDKTGEDSIRSLLARLATLPPMVSSLRC